MIILRGMIAWDWIIGLLAILKCRLKCCFACIPGTGAPREVSMVYPKLKKHTHPPRDIQNSGIKAERLAEHEREHLLPATSI